MILVAIPSEINIKKCRYTLTDLNKSEIVSSIVETFEKLRHKIPHSSSSNDNLFPLSFYTFRFRHAIGEMFEEMETVSFNDDTSLNFDFPNYNTHIELVIDLP